MPGFTGKTKQLSNVTPEAGGLNNTIISWLAGQDWGKYLFNTPDIGGPTFDAYRKNFALNNAQELSQAKETAGTLTGSGLGNILANKMAEQSTRDNATLAGIAENRRSQDTAAFMNMLFNAINSQGSRVQNVYQPGFLDYLGAAGQSFSSALGDKAGASLFSGSKKG